MNSRSSNLAYHSSLTILAFTLAGQLFSFYREVIFGKYFGTTLYFDAFTFIFSILLFIYSLFTVIPFFLIPTLADAFYKDDRLAFSRQLSSAVIMVLVALTVLLSVMEIFSGQIISLLAPGFRNNKDIYSFSVFLFRISAPVLYLMALAQIFRSVLNLRNIFLIPALESLFFNIGIIAAVIFSRNWLQIDTPLSIVFGYYLAYSSFAFLCLFAFIRLERINFLWDIDITTIKRFINEGAYLFFATFLNSLNPLILMWCASRLPEGAVSSLGYVQRILAFSIGTVVNSVMVVFLPAAALSVISKGQGHLKKETEKIISSFFVISLLATALITLNAESIVRLIYNRGLFNDESVKLIGGLLYYYIPWIIFFPMSSIAVRVLYINKDYKNLTIISAAGLIFTLAIVPSLQKTFGINGLGLIASFHMVFYCFLLMAYIGIKYFNIATPGFIKVCIKEFLSMGFFVLVLFTLKQVFVLSPNSYLVINLFVLFPISLWKVNKYADILTVFRNKWN